MNIRQAKQVDLVKYLIKLGFKPGRISGHNYWFHSPFHADRTPSFKVNSKTNLWYDFSDGRGGDIVKFGTLFFTCDESQFLAKLEGSGIAAVPLIKNVSKPSKHDEEKDQIKVVAVKTLQSFPLLQYIKKRCIHMGVAQEFCKEVDYELKGRLYYAVGFKNNSGGYELRNEYIKASSSPKDITFIDRGSKESIVIEGSFDFLSYKTLFRNQQEPLRNYLILNSTSFFEKSLPLMQEHNKVFLFLNNDNTGNKFTKKALDIDPKKFIDERGFYKNYNDINDYLMNFGRTQKHSHHHRL